MDAIVLRMVLKGEKCLEARRANLWISWTRLASITTRAIAVLKWSSVTKSVITALVTT